MFSCSWASALSHLRQFNHLRVVSFKSPASPSDDINLLLPKISLPCIGIDMLYRSYWWWQSQLSFQTISVSAKIIVTFEQSQDFFLSCWLQLYFLKSPTHRTNTLLPWKMRPLLIHWATIQKRGWRSVKTIVAILFNPYALRSHYESWKVRQTYHFPPVHVHSAEASWLSSPVDNLSGLDRHADLEDVVCKEADFPYDIRSIK